MASSGYTTADIVQVTGFSHKQLDYWASTGLLVPGEQQSHGPGTRRLYSGDDLVQLQFIRRLKSYGWSTRKIGQVVKMLREVMDGSDPLKYAILVNGKHTLIALCKTKEGERTAIDALSVGGQQVRGIVVEMLRDEAYQLVTEMKESARGEETIR
ncbi:MAG TPA: MerR family transcriptional regulator [Ktedonobacteraceae bacterium]|jgi:DNA-binding transcriptional MerR regulator